MDNFRARSRDEIAQRLAEDIEPGWYVNLGIGMPTRVADHLPPERGVWLHSENGLLGMGPAPLPGGEDADLCDAGKNYATLIDGASAFDSSMAFAMIRGGHLDLAVLGALQVDQFGNLANWRVPGATSAVGGAMDLAVGAPRVWVAMSHVDSQGRPKIVDLCSLPLTGRGIVQRIYTDLAVFVIDGRGLVLRECADGIDVDYVARQTAAQFEVHLVGAGR